MGELCAGSFSEDLYDVPLSLFFCHGCGVQCCVDEGEPLAQEPQEEEPLGRYDWTLGRDTTDLEDGEEEGEEEAAGEGEEDDEDERPPGEG